MRSFVYEKLQGQGQTTPFSKDCGRLKKTSLIRYFDIQPKYENTTNITIVNNLNIDVVAIICIVSTAIINIV